MSLSDLFSITAEQKIHLFLYHDFAGGSLSHWGNTVWHGVFAGDAFFKVKRNIRVCYDVMAKEGVQGMNRVA